MLVLKACYKLVLGNGLSMPYKISYQSIRCSMCSTAFHVSTCWPPDILGFQIIMHNVYLKNCMFRPLKKKKKKKVSPKNHLSKLDS